VSGAGARGLAERVEALALALGFDRAGVASPEPGPDSRFLHDWLARGYGGEMAYLARRADERADPRRVMPEVRSVVVVALFHPPPPEPVAGHGAAGAEAPARGRVAGYAGGEDYHDVLLDRVRALAAGLEALAERPVETRCYVDTGPVQERVFAARAGIGWIGKNTCVIDPRLGSRMLLGVVLTDLALAPGRPEPDHCGTCRACLDACPTDAFPDPYVLDASRCISYTTIEQRGAIDPALREGQGDWIFGCDVCQDVCPWNRRGRPGALPDPLALRERLAPDPRWVRAELAWVLSLDEAAWREATRGTALRRARHRGLLRNALVAAGNSGDRALRPAVAAHASSADPVLADHARWALERLDGAARPPAAG
jgi:epoxyqueuosine reductase